MLFLINYTVCLWKWDVTLATGSIAPDPGTLNHLQILIQNLQVCWSAYCHFLSFGIQDDHKLSTSQLEEKYGTSIDKVSP